MISFGFRTLHVVMTLRIASSQRKKHKVLKETTHRRKPRWCKTNRLSKANTETKKPSLIKLVTQIELKLLARQGNKLIQVCIKITWWYTPNTLMLEYWITDNPHWDCNCRPTQQRIWEKDILIVIAKTPARYSPYRELYWLIVLLVKRPTSYQHAPRKKLSLKCGRAASHKTTKKCKCLIIHINPRCATWYDDNYSKDMVSW